MSARKEIMWEGPQCPDLANRKATKIAGIPPVHEGLTKDPTRVVARLKFGEKLLDFTSLNSPRSLSARARRPAFVRQLPDYGAV